MLARREPEGVGSSRERLTMLNRPPGPLAVSLKLLIPTFLPPIHCLALSEPWEAGRPNSARRGA